MYWALAFIFVSLQQMQCGQLPHAVATMPSANLLNLWDKINFPSLALLLSCIFVPAMRKAINPSYRCGRKMLQPWMLNDKTRTSLAWSCLTRRVLAYGSHRKVSEPLWSWATNHFSKRWEPCTQQLLFCMALAIKRGTVSGSSSISPCAGEKLSEFIPLTSRRESQKQPACLNTAFQDF